MCWDIFLMTGRIGFRVRAFASRDPNFGDNMMAEHSKTITVLNTLIATTIDSINGYEESAQNIDNERFADLKAAITGRDEKSIINEVERGEDYLKDKWQAALQSGDLDGDAHQLVERCYQSIKSGHDQIS